MVRGCQQLVSESSKRRASALVMVVALLVMLFVIGITFLSTVTFESQSIAGATQAQKQTSVIDGLSREVRTVLREVFLGKDGKAWNNELVYDLTDLTGPGGEPDGVLDTPSFIGADAYGEIPGVNPLLASIEPYQPLDASLPAASWYFYAASDLELAVNDIPMTEAINDGGVSPIQPGTNLVHLDAMLDADDSNSFGPVSFNSDNWSETNDGGTFFNTLVHPERASIPGFEFEFYRRDADGDGVWDSYEYELPIDRYPSTMRGDLADQLRPDGAPPGTAVYYALRVIPHGAMVDVGHAHRTLLEVLPEFVAPPDADTGCVGGPYVAEGEESVLRRRFILPPRDIPLSNLQSRVIPDCTPGRGGQIPETLYAAFANYGTGDWPGIFHSEMSPIRWWPINTGTNGDSLAEILSGTAAAPGWLDWMDPDNDGTLNPPKYDHRHLITTVSHDDNLMRMGRDVGATGDWIDVINENNLGGSFEIDNWPNALNPADPLNGRLKVSLPSLVNQLFAGDLDTHFDPNTFGHANEKAFIETIQDAFMLMLRNVDFNGDGIASAGDSGLIATTAAALTANLIDFADSDDIPTAVDARIPINGMAIGNTAYGLERQPFITEVYYDAGPPAVYAVELYNPYDVAITLGNTYSLKVTNGAGESQSPFTSIPSIGANSFLVIYGDTRPSGGTDPIPKFNFNLGTPVQLIRTVNYSGGPQDIILDEMKAPGGSGGIGGGVRSVQRHSRSDKRWLAPLPYVVQSPPNPSSLRQHAFRLTENVPAELRPVEVQFANSGNMATAYPTTGSLLLLCRYANAGAAPFTASLDSPVVDEFGVFARNKIDNGRMPVFDTSNQGLAVPATSPMSLAIPWGQLVFDYFTVLPLEHDPLVPGYDPQLPHVDQGGLRVHGRIDINAAPWTVLAGLPLVPADSFAQFPATFASKIVTAAALDTLNPAAATPIGAELAQSIVGYREARKITDAVSGDSTADYGTARLRGGTGFLTVGELANVRGADTNAGFNIDSAVGSAADDYVSAVAVLVSLGDWVTTKSHVFTIYGTLRGAGEKSKVDEKAVRFQETVDRLPSFFDNRLPRRIGPRTVGAYTQADRD